jgi:hypothetical protein
MNNNPFIPDDDLEFEAEESANAPEPGDDAYRQDLENDLQITQEQLTDELREQGIYLEYEDGPDDIPDE